ncbi:MAG: DUF1428 family protein [Vicinamibacterales bacterium]
MQYVDGYVVPVPRKNLKAYLRMARLGERMWRKHGAFKSRAHRDRVNAKVMKEMASIGAPKDMPFEITRMVYGGFKALVGA